ncbi:MAG TPA: hypothetical protein VE173_14170, partial [Longimicrobiales bacterium]|nr:hypothetical protein [Longimicrobiales bacterium]
RWPRTEAAVIVSLGALLLVAAVVFFVLQPLLVGRFAPLDKTDDEPSETEARRRVKLLALRDVEYDFATGKLDDEDYRTLKAELSAEALEALDAAERESRGVGSVALEAEIARARQALATGLACEVCGHANPTGSRFCSSCGSELKGAAVGSGSPEGGEPE